MAFGETTQVFSTFAISSYSKKTIIRVTDFWESEISPPS
jgi:hypothetical protein